MKLRRPNYRIILLVVFLVPLIILSFAATLAKDAGEPQTVVSVEFLGEDTFLTGTDFGGTEIGGLSSITYDASRGVYYTLSDDQGDRDTEDPVRYYTVDIDLSDGTLDDEDVTFVDVTQLFESKKNPFPPGGLDPEGFTLGRDGFLFMSTEGPTFTDPTPDPFIRRYNHNGRLTANLPIPDKYIPNGVDWGVRLNLAFESLNLGGYDVVLTNKSGFCHGVITPPETLHMCYCLTPTRYVWRYHDYALRERLGPLTRALLAPLLVRLRMWDRLAADRVDRDLELRPVAHIGSVVIGPAAQQL